MKYIILFEDNNYDLPFAGTIQDGTLKDVAKEIEKMKEQYDWDEDVIESIKVFEVGKEHKVEQKIVVKQTTEVIVK